MKKFLGILALGLLLVGCVQSEKKLTNKKNAKIFKFNATSIIDKKQDSWLWVGIHKGAYYGFGNTPKEASDNAIWCFYNDPKWLINTFESRIDSQIIEESK